MRPRFATRREDYCYMSGGAGYMHHMYHNIQSVFLYFRTAHRRSSLGSPFFQDKRKSTGFSTQKWENDSRSNVIWAFLHRVVSTPAKIKSKPYPPPGPYIDKQTHYEADIYCCTCAKRSKWILCLQRARLDFPSKGLSLLGKCGTCV